MSINRIKVLIAIVAVLLAGITFGYWFGESRHAVEGHDGPAAAEHGERRVLYWQDPMQPNVRFDKPGKSPFMDMDLVPVYADEGDEGPTVRVNPGIAQNLGIRIGRVERKTLQPKLSAVGSVAFDERLTEVVQARTEGYVTRLHARTSLERVRRGQALAEIVSPAWLEAQEEYLALLDAQSDRGRAIREAARQRLVVLGIPEPAIRSLEETRKPLAATTIAAPLDGVVSELGVREGAAFMAGATLFRINGLRTVWVIAQVPEAQVAMLPMGGAVSVRAQAWPEASFKGRVAALLPEVDPQTRTVPVRIVVDNSESRLAPGMYATLEFSGAGREALVVPSEAIIMTGERSVVIVARESGGFDVAEVTVGAETQGNTQVLSGLDEGQAIVLSGQFLIDSEASLRSAVARLSSDHGETHP